MRKIKEVLILPRFDGHFIVCEITAVQDSRNRFGSLVI